MISARRCRQLRATPGPGRSRGRGCIDFENGNVVTVPCEHRSYAQTNHAIAAIDCGPGPRLNRLRKQR
jgi:hypothetical protein